MVKKNRLHSFKGKNVYIFSEINYIVKVININK